MNKTHIIFFASILLSLSIFANNTSTSSQNTQQLQSNQSGLTGPDSSVAHLQEQPALPFIAGDAVKIKVYPDTNTFPSGLYPIDGNGYADFPVLGFVKVVNMSSSQLEDTLKKTFIELLRYPHLTARPIQKVTLLGGFQRPGLYWIDPHATLWQTIQLGGATTRSDGIKKLKWERDRTIINKDLVSLFESEKSLYQIGIKSGDQLVALVRPERTGWDAFKTEVLPMITFTLSSIVTAATVYQSYYLVRDIRNNR